MMHKQTPRLVFVTGTDTGVGKTTLTAMLLAHLRGAGRDALAVKPFCSGSLADAQLLWALQDQVLPLKVVNPHFVRQPVAPLAACGTRNIPSLQQVTKSVQNVLAQCDILLVEGSGGLLVPLGSNYTVADLITALACNDVLVVGRNKLGTINHTLLTISYLNRIMPVGHRIKILLMNPPEPDPSSRTNTRILRLFLRHTEVATMPYLGKNASSIGNVKKNSKKFEKYLAPLLR